MFNPVRSFQNLTNMNQIAISRACWDEESTACTSLAVDSCWLTATLPCYFCHLNLHTCHTSDISYFSSSAAWQQDLGTHPAPPRSAKRRWLLAFKSWEWLLCLLRPNGIAGLFQWSICICWMCVCVIVCVCAQWMKANRLFGGKKRAEGLPIQAKSITLYKSIYRNTVACPEVSGCVRKCDSQTDVPSFTV